MIEKNIGKSTESVNFKFEMDSQDSLSSKLSSLNSQGI